MGSKKQHGAAIDVVAPAGTEIIKGELYRVNKWNGFSISHVLPTDPELGFALEVSNDIWYITVPSGMVAARGDILWWAGPDGFKSGPTQLVVAGTGGAIGPACKVEEAVDSNSIAGVRALNIA